MNTPMVYSPIATRKTRVNVKNAATSSTTSTIETVTMANTHTESDVTNALAKKYGQVMGNGPRYICAPGVRNAAGFSATRTCDFLAIDTWESGHLYLYGHEIKCSRSDWLSELKDPDKAEAFKKHCNYWYLVVSDASVVKDGELPDDWGLMVLDGRGIVTKKKAPLINAHINREYTPLPRSLTVAFMRASHSYTKNLAVKEYKEEVERIAYNKEHDIYEHYHSNNQKWAPGKWHSHENSSVIHSLEGYQDSKAVNRG